MRTRIAAAALAAAALLALTACNSNDDSKSSAPSSTPSANTSSIDAAGLPPKPDAATQRVLLAAVESVDPALADDPDKTVDAARNQCQSLNGGAANPDHLAAQRFGNDSHPLTDTQGKALNIALRASLCPK
jgi:ABC-type Fe3+-hydroxamate transport system substrate-binding protein